MAAPTGNSKAFLTTPQDTTGRCCEGPLHAWNVAQDRMGTQVATAAFALVFEKHSAGEVASPGGYLRGMVEKAGAGELHLERSFYGRLSGQAA